MNDFAHPDRPTMFSMIVTPMHDDGSIDEVATRAHCRRMIDAGCGVYLGSGGSGEGHALTLDELGRLYEIGVEECRGKVPVYCNPPESRSANEMLTKSRLAIAAGADLVQFYQLDSGHGRQPTLAEQFDYFRTVLDQTDYPAGISIHQAVGYLAPASLVATLCKEYPQVKIINIPFGPTMNYLVQLKDTVSPDVKIYVGMHNILSGLAMGAWGAQVTEPNQVPNLCRSLIDYYVAGDLEKAAETYAHILRVGDVIELGRRVSSDGPKGAMEALGFPVGPPRPPRVAVDKETVEKMRAAFEDLGTRALETEAAAQMA